MKNIIGVIGGNGVAATNKLMELIENHYTKNGAIRDCDHPEIIVWQATKAPSRSMFLEGRGESFIPEYIEVAKKLKQCGAKKVAMCCNTAHYAIDEIKKGADVDFIDLIKEVVLNAKEKNIKKIGLMTTDGCRLAKIYDKYFEKFYQSAKLIYPNEEFQKLVTKGICNIKNLHRFDDEFSDENPDKIFKKVKKHLIENGADVVITGCTDIRVSYFEEDNIDSLELLKSAIIREEQNNEQ